MAGPSDPIRWGLALVVVVIQYTNIYPPQCTSEPWITPNARLEMVQNCSKTAGLEWSILTIGQCCQSIRVEQCQ